MTPEEHAAEPVDSTSGEVLLRFADKQVGIVASLAEDVRTDEPDAVHRTRVACRRLRSALTVYGPVVDPAVGAGLVEHLRWYGDVAGAPRDAEVLARHLLEAVASLEGDVRGPVTERVIAYLDERHAAAHARLVAAMAGDRYAAFRHDLAAFLASRPLSAAGRRSPGAVLPALLGAAVSRVAGRYQRALSSPGRPQRWHRVRKAAKEVRYCSEALVGVYGDAAASYAALFEAVAESLGVVQDTVVAEGTLRHLAGAAAARGEPADTYGVLQVREAEIRRAALGEATAALDAALAADRGWLR